MRSFFAVVSALAFASTLVVAQPTSLNDVEPRCSACDAACPTDHFYYNPRSCCLKNGGPSTHSNPPSDRGCPSTWYWHPEQKCCVPKYKPPTTNPTPTCATSTFPKWNPGKHCCEHPSGPTGPQPSPKPAGHYRRDASKQPRSNGHALKAKKSRAVPECPMDYEYCPIAGSLNGDFECVDPVTDMHSCGGCPSLGKGQDCTTIPNSVTVSCKANPSAASTCQVDSCEAGYVPSADRSHCKSLLVSSPQQ